MGHRVSEPASPPQRLTRTVVAGAIGNVLEWYDFGLIGFFAPILSRLFFPSEDRLAALLGTYSLFATGFLMRPLGGLAFGYLGDRLGRKRALELSVVLMAIPTTLMALLPTYAAVGLAAPLMLGFLRLLQGISVGGEYVGSMSFLAEHAPPNRRGFVGSWSSFTVVLGSLMGSGAAALVSGLLPEAQLTSWGWRLPFVVGLVLGLAGLWLRAGVEDSPAFLHSQQAGALASNPIRECLRDHLGIVLMTFALTTLASVGFYLPFVWLPTWLSQINQPPLAEEAALIANTLTLVGLLLFIPGTALLSDRVGRRPMFLASTLGYTLLAYPVFLLMQHGTFATALGGGLLFAGCCSLSAGCLAATLVELFPTRIRYTGVGIGYNLAQALLGGTAPLVATGLIDLSGNHLAPAFYLAGCGAVAAVASWFIPRRHGLPLA